MIMNYRSALRHILFLADLLIVLVNICVSEFAELREDDSTVVQSHFFSRKD